MADQVDIRNEYDLDDEDNEYSYFHDGCCLFEENDDECDVNAKY